MSQLDGTNGLKEEVLLSLFSEVAKYLSVLASVTLARLSTR
ncbi:hypothetical protein [Pseudoxanthomonas mexicana]|nr:hypothetical protein [Pseudoxanthomonas mexicana]